MARRIQSTLGFALLVAGLFFSSVASTDACVCYHPDSPSACEQYKKFDVAFVGRAISVPPNRAEGLVRFRVTQTLKGIAGPEVSVLNEESGMRCGYQFDEGEDYVVFATRNAQGTIDIGPCSSTVWLVHSPDFAGPAFRRISAEAVAFVESLRRPADGGRIFGEVSIAVPFVSPDERDDGQKPVDEFTGLPLGTYQVGGTMPDGLPPAQSARPPMPEGEFSFDFWLNNSMPPQDTRGVTIDDPRSCGYAPFVAHLPPGRYVVGVNLRNLPGRIPATPYRRPDSDLHRITQLGNGTKVDLGVLRLPPPSVKR